MISVDVKHHVYLLTTSIPLPPFSPSLISLMVSVDVKHHVYLLYLEAVLSFLACCELANETPVF